MANPDLLTKLYQRMVAEQEQYRNWLLGQLDRLDAETRFLGKQHFGTIGELTAHRDKASAEIDTLTGQRQELRKKVRRLMSDNVVIYGCHINNGPTFVFSLYWTTTDSYYRERGEVLTAETQRICVCWRPYSSVQ